MVQSTQQQRNKMTALSQQLESKYLTEILNTIPRGRANEEQRKLRQDMEATKTQSPEEPGTAQRELCFEHTE